MACTPKLVLALTVSRLQANLNSWVLVAVSPATVTDRGPSTLPEGTVTSRLVVVALVTVAGWPLKVTRLLAGVVLKFDPDMVTVIPVGPAFGKKSLMVVIEFSSTKGTVLSAVWSLTVTRIRPVISPDGTVATRLLEEAVVIVARTPLNLTVFWRPPH